MTEPEVLIIGAGMAGLTAARALAESGISVLVLEAQNRIGGRIHTQHIGTEAIELGAEFIHGRSPELWALIDEAGLETYERDGAQICFDDSGLNACPDELADLFDPLEKLENFTGPDLTFAEYLDREAIPAEDRYPTISYVEGFNAADHREISTASWAHNKRPKNPSRVIAATACATATTSSPPIWRSASQNTKAPSASIRQSANSAGNQIKSKQSPTPPPSPRNEPSSPSHSESCKAAA